MKRRVCPGGNIFVPAALLLETDSEAEFAGMLAHSISHVVARHGTRQASQVRAADLGTIPMIFVGGQSGLCSGGLNGPLSFRVMQRTYELEADALAIEIVAHAGFDPTALVNYIQRIQPQESLLGPLSLLPTRNERVESMNSVIDRLPPSNYEETRSEFAEIQERIRSYAQPLRPAGAPTLRRP
jgi:predicted Zn-dependent protease